MLFHDRNEGFKINFSLLKELFIVLSNYQPLNIQKSSWKTSEIPFSTYIRTWSEQDFHFMFLSKLKKER